MKEFISQHILSISEIVFIILLLILKLIKSYKDFKVNWEKGLFRTVEIGKCKIPVKRSEKWDYKKYWRSVEWVNIFTLKF